MQFGHKSSPYKYTPVPIILVLNYVHSSVHARYFGAVLKIIGFSMLFRPVYIRSAPMRFQTPIPKVRPPTPEKEPTPLPPSPSPTPPPSIEEVQEEQEIEEPLTWRMPMLICGEGVTAVYPKEATRDVLSGKVDYLLVDERGVTLFPKKHIFTVLKLTRGQKGLYEDYPCVGAHQRVFGRSTKRGLSHKKRHYHD